MMLSRRTEIDKLFGKKYQQLCGTTGVKIYKTLQCNAFTYVSMRRKNNSLQRRSVIDSKRLFPWSSLYTSKPDTSLGTKLETGYLLCFCSTPILKTHFQIICLYYGRLEF